MESPPPVPMPERIPGISFAPEDDQLLTLYLGPKLARQPLPAATADFIHEADVYAADPDTLCSDFTPAYWGIEESSRVWYFFTCPRAKNSRGSRRSRTVGANKGTWHAESRKDVFDGESLVGYRRSFSHETSSGERTGWLMMEFGFGDDQEDGTVVCKIYKTPRPGKKGKAKDPAAPSALIKKRKAKDEGRSDSAARVRRRLNFRSPPAVLEDGFLNKSQRQHSEAEEPKPAFDPISFLANGHELSALSCNDAPVQSESQIAPENYGSWITAAPFRSGEEFFNSSQMPVETRPEESTSAGDCSALTCPDMPPGAYWASPAAPEQYGETSAVDCSSFLNDHASFAPSFPDTTLLPSGADWASTAASEQYSQSCFGSCTTEMGSFASSPVKRCYGQSCYGSCTEKMEFFASSPVSRFEDDTPIYWSAEPSYAPTASSATSTPLRSSSGAEWAYPMLPPLHGFASECLGVCPF